MKTAYRLSLWSLSLALVALLSLAGCSGLTPTPSLTATVTLTLAASSTITLTPTLASTPTPTSTQTPTASPSPIPPDALIAYLTDHNGRSDLYTVNVRTRKEGLLVSEVGHDTAPVWSPDGTQLVYNHGALYAVNADGSGADGSGETKLTGQEVNSLDPAWSPDGTRLVFSSPQAGGHWALFICNADGTGQTAITGDTAGESAAVWSPDGKRLAFTAKTTIDFPPQIYIVNADGSGQLPLTRDLTGNVNPVWSPDGTQLAFVSWRDGEPQIYTMKPDGSQATRLTDSPNGNEEPAWSPDGSRITFVSWRDEKNLPACAATGACNSEIYVMNADGSGQTRLTNSPAIDEAPAWSPDGTQLAFISFRDESAPSTCGLRCRSEVYVMQADGSGVTRLTFNSSAAWAPAWRPRVKAGAGAEVATPVPVVRPTATQAVSWQMITAQNATRLELVAEWKVDYDNLFDVKWSPDGKFLAISGSRTHLYDAKTFQGLDETSPGGGQIAFSPDSRDIAMENSSPSDFTLSLWDLEAGRVRQTLQGHTDWIEAVAFAPNRPLLATGGLDKVVRLWDASSPLSVTKPLRELRHFDMPIWGLAFSPDGKALAVASTNAASLWNPDTGQFITRLTLPARRLIFSPDGRYLAIGNNDATVRVWDLQASRLLYTLTDYATTDIWGLVFSLDGSLLVSGRDSAQLWDMQSGGLLSTLDQASGSFAFNPAGTWLASADYGGWIRIFGVREP